MMENKHPENKNSKKVDKVRRKLLIGAATTPLILTLHTSRSSLQAANIAGWAKDPSKAKRDGDDLAYSGLLVGSGGGNEDTELSLYVYLIAHDIVPTVPAYANMMASRDAWVVAQVQGAANQTAASGALAGLLAVMDQNGDAGWSVLPGEILPGPEVRPAWDEANGLFVGLNANRSSVEENPEDFSLFEDPFLG